MQTLRIYLLRQPAILWGETPINNIPRRALRHLLFYLACQPDIDRATLCAMFWEEGADAQVRARLRTSLAKLRAALPDPTLIAANSERVRLDMSRVWVDVQEFRNLVKFNLRPANQIPTQNPLPEALAQNLRTAVDLWEANQVWPGADFLDTPELEDWLENLRQGLLSDYLRIQERLAFNAAAHNDLDRAFSRIRRILDLDPLNDAMHVQLLAWLVKAGRKTQALEYGKIIHQTYTTHGISLPEGMRRQIEASEQDSPAPENGVRTSPWPASLVTSIPFLNREGLIQEFKANLPRGGLFTVFGEAGSGKTRFLFEVISSLQPPPRLLLLNGRPSEQTIPFQALVNALRRQVTPEEWQALDSAWAAPLAILLPELLSLRPNLSPPPVDSISRPVLQEALQQLLLILAKSAPVFLAVDDAQWCDPATFEALAAIGKTGFFYQHGVLIVSCRLEDQSPAFRQFLLLETTGMNAFRVKLERFSPDELERVAQYILGQSIPSLVVQQLTRETGGNPFFLLEALYWIMSSGPIDLNQLSYQLPISGYVHALTNERLHHLTPHARRVVETAAVMGETFTPALLEAASALPSEQVANAIEELEGCFLIQPIPGAQLAYCFVYASAREVILPSVSSARQRLMHLRAARALEANSGAAPQASSAQLAHHYQHAGETLPTIRHWINAGKFALLHASPAQAQQALSQAEALLMQDPSAVPNDLLYQLFNTWNDLASASANAGLLHQVNEHFLELAETRLDPLLIGSALNGMARAALHANDVTSTLRLCDRAAFYIDQSGDLYEVARLCNTRGDTLERSDQLQAAIKAFNQTLLHCEQAHDARLLDKKAHAQFSLSEIYFAMGFPLQVIEMARGCLRTSLKAKSPEWTMKALFMLAMATYYLGNMPEALDYARQGVKLAASLKNNRYIAFFDIALSRIELAQGWLTRSWQHHLEAETLGKEDFPPRAYSLAASHRGQTLRFLRQFQQATQAYRTGIERSVFAFDRLECQFRLGLALAGEDKIEEALATLRDCLAQSRAIQHEFIALLAEASLLIILAQNGQVEAVKQALPALIERASGRMIVEIDASIDYIHALVALAENRPEDARAHLEGSTRRAAAAGILWWELQGWVTLAQTGADRRPFQARVQKLLDVLSQHSLHLPELAEPVRGFKRWVKQQMEYT